MREGTRQTIRAFDKELGNLIVKHLYAAATPEQVNEFYGYEKDCQIAAMLRETIKELESLEAQGPPPTQ